MDYLPIEMQGHSPITFRDRVRIAIALIVSALAAYGATRISHRLLFDWDQYFDTDKMFRSISAEDWSITIGFVIFFVALWSCLEGRKSDS